MGIKEHKINKRRLRSSYVTSIISISLVLFLFGLVGLLILNTKRISDFVKENIGFSIILKEDIKEVDIIRLQKMLDAKPYIKSTEYITKERAAKELQEELGEDFIEFLGYNPLLSSIDIKLQAEYANNDSIVVIENEFQSYHEIKEVFYKKSLIQEVNENVNKISLIILSFSLLLLLISLALINNTIRLSVYAKRFIINTMQLVGATRRFIRKPFLFRSAIHGMYGALIAILLIIGVLYLLQNEFSDIIGFDDVTTLIILFVIVIMAGIIISVTSTYFAVNKYLKIKRDRLYY